MEWPSVSGGVKVVGHGSSRVGEGVEVEVNGEGRGGFS